MATGLRAMEIVVVEIEREEGSAVVTGVVRAGVGPLASDGLDEALGLAIGLGPVRCGEEMCEAELVAGSGKEPGAIRRTAIGEDGLDGDAMSEIKSQSVLGRGGGGGGGFFFL